MSRMALSKALAFLVLVGSTGIVWGATKLNVGDPAPALKPAKWLKGAPIPEFKKGQVYVVEFWATWCGPCKQNIPHLTAMAKKFAGKADIIGVDIWESPDPTINTLPKVAAFVKSEGHQMDYHVAADATNNRVADAWVKAAGESGIPVSFIVGRDGHVAWIGHPANLESTLQQVIDGTFDVSKSKAARTQETGPMQALQAALAAKDYVKANSLVDDLMAKEPANARRYEMFKLVCQAHLDLPAFEKKGSELLAQSNGEIGTYQMLCSIFATEAGLSPEAYQYGKKLDQEALAKKDREYMFLAMGAAIDVFLGDHSGAIESQTAAVEKAKVDPHCPPEFLQFLQHRLDELKAGKS